MTEDVELYEAVSSDPEAALPGLGWKSGPKGWTATLGETPCCHSGAGGHLYLYADAPYCVKCHKCDTATAVTTILQQEGHTYGEALDELRRRLGLPVRVLSDGARRRAEEAERRAELLEAYLSFSQSYLPQCEAALRYLEGRGWTGEAAQSVEWGAVPPYAVVKKWQEEKGYTYNALQAVNLTDREGKLEGRVVIPCRGRAGGRLEGLSLRAIDGREPKYWQAGGKANGAGLWAARGQGERVVIVEGDFDAAAVKVRLPDTPVIALSGKTLQPETIAAAARLGLRDLYLALDTDAEGQKAIRETVRAVYRFQADNPTPAASSLGVYVVDTADLAGYGKDADEWTRTEEGKEALIKAFHEARAGWRWVVETDFLPQWKKADTDREKGETFRAVKEFVAALPRSVAVQVVAALEATLGELPAAVVAAGEEAERAAREREAVQRLTRQAETELRKLREEGADPATVGAALRQTLEKVEGAAAAAARPSPLGLAATLDAAAGLGEGRHCGWEQLEQLGWRLRPAELTIVAARPGVGKTAFLSNLVVNVLRDPNAGPVLLVQAELSLWQAYGYLLAPYAARRGERWSYGEIIRQLASGNLEDPLREAAQSFDEQTAGRLYVVTDPLTPGQIAAQTEAIEREQGKPLALIGVDYLELLQSEQRQETAELRVSAIADGLLEVAKEQRVAVVALSQFNREASEEGGGGVEMLRYSDRTGALASTVFSLSVRNTEEAEVDLKVVARKNRYGPKNKETSLTWDRARGLMTDEPLP
jgi:replicative DNA helicase